MDMKQIASFIKKRRKQLNITQQNLADISGISTRKLSDIETSKGTTTIEILNKVCETLGVEIVLKVKGVDE